MKALSEVVFTLTEIVGKRATIGMTDYQVGTRIEYQKGFSINETENFTFPFTLYLEAGGKHVSSMNETFVVVKVKKSSVTLLNTRSLSIHKLRIGESLTVGLGFNPSNRAFEVTTQMGNAYAGSEA